VIVVAIVIIASIIVPVALLVRRAESFCDFLVLIRRRNARQYVACLGLRNERRCSCRAQKAIASSEAPTVGNFLCANITPPQVMNVSLTTD
jgi:hypothetical protein